MMTASGRNKGVEYLGPGESAWRPVEDVHPEEEAEKRRRLRARARSLLQQANAEAKDALHAQKHHDLKSRSQASGFEAEMAAAVGAWDRFAEAGARKIFAEVEDFSRRVVEQFKGRQQATGDRRQKSRSDE